MDNKKKAVFAVLLLVIVLGLVWYFVKNRNTGLTASGTIEATEVVVSSKSVGRILELKIDEGSAVQANDVLAIIESSEIEQTLKSLESRQSVAKDDYLRAKKLYRNNLISSQQYEMAKSAFVIASSQVDTAKIQLDNTTIKSPISGTVITKAVEVGELATAGTPIATIANLKNLKLTVYLAETDLGKVKIGDNVNVLVDSFPNEKFEGKIDYISNKAEFTPKSIQTKDERVTQVFALKIKIPNESQKLKPGMPADAEFIWNMQ